MNQVLVGSIIIIIGTVLGWMSEDMPKFKRMLLSGSAFIVIFIGVIIVLSALN